MRLNFEVSLKGTIKFNLLWINPKISVDNLFFYAIKLGENCGEKNSKKNWNLSVNEATLNHQVRDKRPKIRFRAVV